MKPLKIISRRSVAARRQIRCEPILARSPFLYFSLLMSEAAFERTRRDAPPAIPGILNPRSESHGANSPQNG
jgi:uncharacterized membrane protein